MATLLKSIINGSSIFLDFVDMNKYVCLYMFLRLWKPCLVLSLQARRQAQISSIVTRHQITLGTLQSNDFSFIPPA